MTMHLAKGLTTINTGRRKTKKLTKKQQADLAVEHKQYNQQLRQSGRSNQMMTFEQYVAWVTGKAAMPTRSKPRQLDDYQPTYTNYRRSTESDSIPSFDGKTEVAARKESPKYTGTLVKGIAVLHKSCMQPVINKEQAIEAATMRRN